MNMVKGTKRNSGFTLVEILIVVVILGILAAIVIPQFTNASESAKSNSLYTQLQTIRSQLELYQVQHNGNYPLLADLTDDTGGAAGDGWGKMINKTDVAGAIGVDPDVHIYGPYLQQAPMNPFTNSSVAAAAEAAGNGWVYDEDTGAISAVGFDEATGEYTAPVAP